MGSRGRAILGVLVVLGLATLPGWAASIDSLAHGGKGIGAALADPIAPENTIYVDKHAIGDTVAAVAGRGERAGDGPGATDPAPADCPLQLTPWQGPGEATNGGLQLIPEPATFVLFGLGGLGILVRLRPRWLMRVFGGL